MKEVLVLGIGNRLMMDDGIGVHVIEELSRRSTNPVIRYVVGETDIYYCLHQIEEAVYTIIVDAAYPGNKPGTISIFLLQQVLKSPIQSISAHESHLFNEIRLIGKNIKGMLICIEPYEINYGISLSPVLQAQFLRIVDCIEKIIRTHAG